MAVAKFEVKVMGPDSKEYQSTTKALAMQSGRFHVENGNEVTVREINGRGVWKLAKVGRKIEITNL
jgi:hypothetical protein